MISKLTPTIGMEIHVELKTISKMFCGCPADHFSKPPNTQTCPVCLGLPGTLPVPNRQAIEWTMMIGHALNCHINQTSKFDRKHYFYPDLPKGYQISQYDEPFCEKGYLETVSGKVSITRVHLEEDTGKLQHKTLKSDKVTLVDFNRSGVPLVEIVSEPEIYSSKQAGEYARKIRNLVQFLGVSNGDLEKGSMRLEANISWGLDLNYKVEVKNINSYRFLEQAIDYELNRQKLLLDQGITPAQETRGWHESKNVTFSQRTKETSADYRYFPEPDIPPMQFTDAQIQVILSDMPMLPKDYHQLFVKEFNIRPDYADILTLHQKLAQKSLDAFKLARSQKLMPGKVANFIINQKQDAENLTASQIVDHLLDQKSTPTVSASDHQLWIQTTINANPELVQKYQSGKTQVIGALIGEVMKSSQGQADPQLTAQLLKTTLDN